MREPLNFLEHQIWHKNTHRNTHRAIAKPRWRSPHKGTWAKLKRIERHEYALRRTYIYAKARKRVMRSMDSPGSDLDGSCTLCNLTFCSSFIDLYWKMRYITWRKFNCFASSSHCAFQLHERKLLLLVCECSTFIELLTISTSKQEQWKPFWQKKHRCAIFWRRLCCFSCTRTVPNFRHGWKRFKHSNSILSVSKGIVFFNWLSWIKIWCASLWANVKMSPRHNVIFLYYSVMRKRCK